MLVFANAFVETRAPVKGVHVVNRKYLATFLQRQGHPSDANKRIWEQREEIAAWL